MGVYREVVTFVFPKIFYFLKVCGFFFLFVPLPCVRNVRLFSASFT